MAIHDARFHMVQFPIWSYMENRSTLEATRRVSQHCIEVRQLIQMCRSTPHARAARVPKVSLCGGLQLCIDLQRAFDNVNRVKLFARLHELQVREEIRDHPVVGLLARANWLLCAAWLHWRSNPNWKRSAARLQGCKAAPGPWNSFVVLFIHDLLNHVPLSWVQACLTIYADDCHIGTSFTSMEDFCHFHHTLCWTAWTFEQDSHCATWSHWRQLENTHPWQRWHSHSNLQNHKVLGRDHFLWQFWRLQPQTSTQADACWLSQTAAVAHWEALFESFTTFSIMENLRLPNFQLWTFCNWHDTAWTETGHYSDDCHDAQSFSWPCLCDMQN